MSTEQGGGQIPEPTPVGDGGLLLCVSCSVVAALTIMLFVLTWEVLR